MEKSTSTKVEEYIEILKKLKDRDPELAKKIAMEHLQKVGIIDEKGKIKPPYNGEKVNDDDFTIGPGEIEYEGEER